MAQIQKDSSAWSAVNTTVWDIVNPITNLGAQFFGGPFSYPTYWRMATKGVANVDPFFISRFLSFIPKYVYNNSINPSLKVMGWDQGVNGFFKKVGGFFDKFKIAGVKFDKEYGFVVDASIREDFYQIDKLDKLYKKRLKEKHNITKLSLEDSKKVLRSDKRLQNILSHKFRTKLKNKATGKLLVNLGIRTLGWIGLAYTTYDIVKTVGEGLNFLHEMSVNLAQDIEAKRQHMLKVDFNKPLYGGYLTAGAYTERQRAIRLLARNPGLPRPAIGNEAYRYSGGY